MEVGRKSQSNISFTDLSSPTPFCSVTHWKSYNTFLHLLCHFPILFSKHSHSTFFLNALLLWSAYPQPFSTRTSYEIINFHSLKRLLLDSHYSYISPKATHSMAGVRGCMTNLSGTASCHSINHESTPPLIHTVPLWGSRTCQYLRCYLGGILTPFYLDRKAYANNLHVSCSKDQNL